MSLSTRVKMTDMRTELSDGTGTTCDDSSLSGVLATPFRLPRRGQSRAADVVLVRRAEVRAPWFVRADCYCCESERQRDDLLV